MESNEEPRNDRALSAWALPIVEAARKEHPVAKPKAYYFAPGDQISCFWDRGVPYAQRIDGAITVYRSVDCNKLVGFTIKDVSEYLKKMPNGGVADFKCTLEDGTLQIELWYFVFNALNDQSEPQTSERKDAYRTIIERAGRQKVAIPKELATSQ